MASKLDRLAANLTADQLKAADLLAVNRFLPKEDRLTFGQISEQVNISERQFYNWRSSNDEFIKYVNYRASQAFEAHLPDFMEKHLEMSLKGQGSMKGIELFYKFNGLLVDKTEVKTEDSGQDRAALEERLARLKARKEGVE